MPVTNFTKVTTALLPSAAAPENWIEVAAVLVDDGDEPDGFTSPTAYGSVAEMLADGWLVTDAAAIAAENYFGQGDFNEGQVPVSLVVIKRAVPVAQVWEFDVLAFGDGTYKLFIATVGGSAVEAASLAAAGLTATQIKDQLITAFNLGVFATTHTAATVDANSGTITADVAGVPFVLTATGPNGEADFDVDVTTPGSGIYEDLDTAWAAEPFWMVLPDPTEAEGTMTEVSRWCEAGESFPTQRRNVCILQTTDADILTSTEPNFADDMITLERECTFVLYHVNMSDKMMASYAGRYIKLFPGSKAWHYGRVNGTTLTTTINFDHDEGEDMIDARCSWIERNGSASTDFVHVFGGVGSNAYTLAQKHTEHAWWLRCSEAMVAMQEKGVTLDEEGQATIAAAIRGVTAGFGTSVVQDSLVINFVPFADVPDAELAIGDYMTTGGVELSIDIPPQLSRLRVEAKFSV
jgi:hypothetical protein